MLVNLDGSWSTGFKWLVGLLYGLNTYTMYISMSLPVQHVGQQNDQKLAPGLTFDDLFLLIIIFLFFSLLTLFLIFPKFAGKFDYQFSVYFTVFAVKALICQVHYKLSPFLFMLKNMAQKRAQKKRKIMQ